MDDEDYSWVRRTRFSHSVVRSNSGREQFGAFVEQFNRGAALKQYGSSSGFKLHGLNMEPRTKLPAASPSAARSRSVNAQPKTKPEDSPSYSKPKASNHGLPFQEASLKPEDSCSVCKPKASDHGRPFQEASPKPEDSCSESSDSKPKASDHDRPFPEALPKQDDKDGAGNNGGGSLFVEVQSPRGEILGPLDFSFHPDEQSLRLQRVCSSPSPFPSKNSPVAGAPARSTSLKVTGEGPKPKLRAISPLPTRPVPEVFAEAKSASKRFSTPPPRRRSLSPPRTLRAPGKLKHMKELVDNAKAKAAALTVLEKWSVDRSQLLIGNRFASGAHSRLFHGLYMEQPVAVKFIRQPDEEEDAELAAQLEKQFNTEITTLCRLHHPNVIKLVGACSSPPVFCVITEFLPGGSLRAFLHKQEHKSLPLETIISIGFDIAHGMGYIHSQGVVHRDVKPENIIFDGESCAKIVDFGIACEEAYCDPLANDPGTFRWMAPEMMKHKPYGRKVDVYSFGLILWEMFTGSVPYEDLTPFQAAFAVFDKNVRRTIPSSCPAALRLLIEQCWALQPDKRPEFWQIVQVLEKFEMVLHRDGTLDNMPISNCQGTHDHKNWLAHWVQKLKHHSHHDLSGLPPPKLL